MATETDKDAPLARAIDNADEHTLRAILKSMCQASETCRREAMDRMLVSRKRDIIELSDSSDEDTKRQKKNKKQKKVEVAQISKFEKCETCKKTYDVTLNNDTACRMHPDLLQIDPDFFLDDDDVQYDIGSIDPYTDWRRKEWPEGFIWLCCEETLNAAPCQIQRHIPKKG